MGDPSDFGDKIPLLIAFVLTIANRFVYGKIAQLKILIGLLVMTRNLPGTRFLWTSDRCSLMRGSSLQDSGSRRVFFAYLCIALHVLRRSSDMASRIRSNAIFSFSLDVANDSLMKPSPHLPKASPGTTATLDLPSSFMASSWDFSPMDAMFGKA